MSGARLGHADLSHANVSQAVIHDADVAHANLHALVDDGASWAGTNVAAGRATDHERLQAERWLPPEHPARHAG